MADEINTGGCQCGAVRFRVEGKLGDASVCHCRMCQKASGNFYLPLVSVRGAKLVWTRGERKRFRSSNVVWRGFCGDCGTPLTYEAPDGMALAIAAFDRPEGIAPTIQWGVEGKLPYVDHVSKLPRRDHGRPRGCLVSCRSRFLSAPRPRHRNLATGGKRMNTAVRTGGCQCGAVRFRIRGELGRPSICHCRMCQKQFGSFFSALVTAPKDGVEWTRDEPSYFQSSVNIDRGFCPKCGTPLTYRHPGGLEIAIGAFDDRSDLAPKIQVNYQSRLPWVESIFEQPVHDDPDYYGRQEQIISFQHPDHETEQWPPGGVWAR